MMKFQLIVVEYTGLKFTKGVINPRPKALEEGGWTPKLQILSNIKNSQCMIYWPIKTTNLYFKLGFIFQCHLGDYHFLCLTKSANFEITSFNIHPILGFGLKKPMVNCKPVYSTAINWKFIIVDWLINKKYSIEWELNPHSRNLNYKATH